MTIVKLGFVLSGITAIFVLSSCATVLYEDGAIATVPYSISDSGLIVVDASVNGAGPYEFALDTGASISVVFEQLRNQLSIQPLPDTVVKVHGAVTSGEFPLLRIDRLDVGQAAWLKPRIVGLPGETEASADVDGIFGVDFLKRYAIGFSVSDRVVRLYPPDLVSNRAYRGWANVPLQREKIFESGASLYFIELQIEGRTFPAVFDLGAGLNTINWPAARKLGISEPNSADEDLYAGVLGRTPLTAQFIAKETFVGRIRWRNRRS